MPVIVRPETAAAVPGTGPRLMLTPEPGGTPPRVRIDLAGFTPGSSVQVTRVDPDGRLRGVREAEPILINASGGQLAYDTELPYNAQVLYAAPGAARQATRLDVRGGWLIAPGDPGASVRLGAIRARQASTWASGTQLVRVLNRPAPVPVTNVARLSGTSGLTVRTDTHVEADRLLALFQRHAVLLLNIPAYQGVPATWEYIAPGDLTMDYLANGSKPARAWSFDYTVVDRPDGGAKAQFTVDTVRQLARTVAETRLLWATVGDSRTDTRRLD